MSNKEQFLLEVGVAEMPARSLDKLTQQIRDNLVKSFEKAGIGHSDFKIYYTPRRLVFFLDTIETNVPAKSQDKKGPAIKSAFDENGNPTKAIIGFAKSLNINIEDLEKRGEYMYGIVYIPSRSVIDILPELITKALYEVKSVKGMRWGDLDYEFLRPVNWLLCLLGERVVQVEAFNLLGSNITYGHRAHSNKQITIHHASDYFKTLEKNYVIVDQEKRRIIIKNGIKSITDKHTCKCPENDELLQEVVCLIEYPNPLHGKFDKEFLELPKEVLRTTIISHQKCFPLEQLDGSPFPGFILVSNIQPENTQLVIKGNEQVMLARLSDAKFFFDSDKKQELKVYIEKLENVSMHQKLGSIAQQSSRIGKIIKEIDPNIKQANRIGELAKFDLVTDMVGEFPELQGIMGSYYASLKNEDEDVIVAIKEQYLGVDDLMPASYLGSLLAISYRLDHLVGYFGIGMIPKGDQDPFALRRSALIIIRIILNNKINIDLNNLFEFAINNYSVKLTCTTKQLLQYIYDRLKSYYLDQDINHTVIDAVLNLDITNLLDIEKRIVALNKFLSNPNIQELAAGNKRVRRILIKCGSTNSTDIKKELFENIAESSLFENLLNAERIINPLVKNGQYENALIELAKLRVVIDDFFDNTMVMCDDKSIRQNRLNLLAKLQEVFMSVADMAAINIEES